MALVKNKVIFVHINKSGGSFIVHNINKNFKNTIGIGHRSLNDIYKKYHPNMTTRVATIVRNPYERMVSMYHFYKYATKDAYGNYYPGAIADNTAAFFSLDEEDNKTFNNWIKYIYSDKFNRKNTHSAINIFNYCYSNQLNWLMPYNKNNITIFRFEDKDLYKKIRKWFNKELNIYDLDLKTKLATSKHLHYSTYYNEESKSLVQKHYQKDIDFFGYTFDNIN